MKNASAIYSPNVQRHERAFMNCKQCSELLVDYSRSELPADLTSAIASHLSTCNNCATELMQLHELETLLDHSEQPSNQLRENFHARLTNEIAQSSRNNRQLPPPRAGLFQTLWPARPFAAVCYSFALLACGLVSGQLLPPATLGFTNNVAEQQNAQRNIPQICSIPLPPNNNLL
jgi:anti-sigma factor RsiW